MKVKRLLMALGLTASSLVIVGPVKEAAALSNCTAIVAGIQGYPYYRWGGICYNQYGTLFQKAVQTCRIGSTTYIDQYGNSAGAGERSWTPTCSTGLISNRRYLQTNNP
jgi:hypothetical protein